VEVPIDPHDALANEWAIVIDAPGYSACLLAWEHPSATPSPDGERRFEAIWTVDPELVFDAADAAASLAQRAEPNVAGRLRDALGPGGS
jgi:DICT domain-containing protein